jgi:SAM-dependent methyltransferase
MPSHTNTHISGNGMADEWKQEIAGLFGRAARTYGRVGPDFFWPLGRALVEWAEIGPGEAVLDVAAGTGALGLAAAARGADVAAVDLAPAMVDEARRNGLATRVMDAERLEFANASFDRLLCGFGIFLLPDPPAALAEWRRVLRPGGSLWLSTFVRRDPRWAWTAELVPERLRSSYDDGDSFDDSREGLEALLLAAGYSNVRFTEAEHTLAFANAEEWLTWLWSHGHRELLESLTEAELDAYAAGARRRIAELDRIENTVSARFTGAARP